MVYAADRIGYFAQHELIFRVNKLRRTRHILFEVVP